MARKRPRPAKNRPASPPETPSGWNALSESRQHAVVALILVAVSLGFFAPVHFSSGELVGSDTVQWRSMAHSMLTYHDETGSQALWSTNAFGGMPGFMISYPSVIPQADLIVNVLRKWLWPSSHLILLLFGVYLLTWMLTRNKLAGLFSAVAFGLTTYIPVILMAGHNSKFVAMAWAPWLLLAFAYSLRKPSLKSALLFAAALALNLRAGHVQITYYVAIIMAVWWLAEAVRAVRAGETGPFVRTTVWLAGGAAVGLLMVAQPYLANAEYKRYTIRGATAGGAAGSMTWEYAMGWSQGPRELITLLAADSFGGSSLYWGPKPFTGGPHYLGALTLVLAVLALIRNRDSETRGLGIASLVMMLFALGEHFPLLNRPMYEHFPLFNAFRVPETWLAAVALTASILAGKGLATLLAFFEERNLQRSAYALFGATASVLLFMMVTPDTFLSFERDGEQSRIFEQVKTQYPGISEADPRVREVLGREMARRKDERRKLFESDATRSVLFLALGLVIVLLLSRRKVPDWLAGFGLVALVVLDLGGVGRRYVSEDRLVRPATGADEVQEYAFDRFIRQKVEEAGGPGHLRVLSLEFSRDPFVNARPSYFYESLGGYHGAKLRLYQDYLERILFLPGTGSLNPTALTIMNTRFVVGPRAVPGYEMVFQDDASGNSVFENPDVLPRASFVSFVETTATAEETWSRLASPDFDPRTTMLLAGPTDLPSTPVDSSSTARADLLAYGPREIEWEVETDAPRWLLVSEVYYPAGWRAFIDGEPADIHRADYLLRGLHVPTGSHRVRMTFDPASHTTGVRIAGISTLFVYGGLLFLFVMGILERRRDSTGK